MKTPTAAAVIAAFGISCLATIGAAEGATTTTQDFRVTGPTVVWSTSHSGATPGMIQNQSGAQQHTFSTEIDSTNATIRAFGSVTAMTFTMNGSQSHVWQAGTTTPVFPNPPQPIYDSANMSYSMTVTIPSFSFDTGPMSYFWNGTAYAFAGYSSQHVEATVTITASLTTGGQTFSETETAFWNFHLIPQIQTINAQNYPDSLSISPGFVFAAGAHSPTYFPVIDGIGSNGFEFEMSLIPEPSAGILSMLAGGLLFLRRRRA